MNLRYITFIILLAFLISYMPLGYPIVEGQEELPNPLQVQPKNVAGGIFSWIFNFGLAILFPLFIFFVISYLFIAFGLKILKIERISRSKIVVYIFVMFLISSFLQPAVNKSLGGTVTVPILYLINTLISFGIAFLLLRYYFLLSGKKLWQILFYLIIVNLIFSLIIFSSQHQWGTKNNEGLEEKLPSKEVIKDETTNWKAYRNEEYGFEINYPKDWMYEQNIFSFKPDLVFCPLSLAEIHAGETICKLKLGVPHPQYEDGMIYLFHYTNDQKPTNPAYHYLGVGHLGYYYLYSPASGNEAIINQMLATFRFLK